MTFTQHIAANVAWLLCEIAFKTDCWGPFAWFHTAGSRLYDVAYRD